MSVVTVVATVEAGNVPPRVRLDVTDTGTPAISAVTVTRLDPDGRTVPVRTGDGNPLPLNTSGSDRVGLLYDYEAPFGQPVTYSTTEYPAGTSAPVTVDEQRVWLTHPGVPSLSIPVTVSKFGERSKAVQRGVFFPMGRSTAVVQTDGARKAAQYELSILTFTDDERTKLDALLSDTGVLLLNVPIGKGWGVTAEYVSVGDVTEARVTSFPGEPLRVWALACQVVDRPVGGSQAARSYVDIMTDFTSYAELPATYDTYLDLLSGQTHTGTTPPSSGALGTSPLGTSPLGGSS